MSKEGGDSKGSYVHGRLLCRLYAEWFRVPAHMQSSADFFMLSDRAVQQMVVKVLVVNSVYLPSYIVTPRGHGWSTRFSDSG